MSESAIQQELALPPPPKKRTHGGKRRGAGRKRTHDGKPRIRHAARPTTDYRLPIHVTKRVRSDVKRLRRYELCKVLRAAFVNGCRKDQFRICQFSIQGNHIHMICEATDTAALASGIQGWSVRIARGLNRHLGRKGSVFYDRYHMEILRTPTQTRNALCYVLQNARRHGESLEARWHGMDPFSSAWWFDGWVDPSWKKGLSPPEARTVASAQTWMLRIGWRKCGLISIDERPRAARH